MSITTVSPVSITTSQESTMITTVLDPLTGLTYNHDAEGRVVPVHPSDYTSPRAAPQALGDLEICHRRGTRARNINEVLEDVLRDLASMGEIGDLLEEAPVATREDPEFYASFDSTLAFVEEIIDPSQQAMTTGVAQRLTDLFKSSEFNATNFPEMPGAHMRRLKWIAKQRGFNSVREVLLAVGDGHKFKSLKGLSLNETLTQLDGLLSRPGRLSPEAVAPISGVITRIAKALRDQESKVKKTETKAKRGSLYHNRVVLVWNGQRLRFSQEFGAPSLLESIIEVRKGPQTQPVSFQILNQDPAREAIPSSIRRQLNAAGIIVIKDKAGIPLIMDNVPMEERPGIMANLTICEDPGGDPSMIGQVNWAWVKANHRKLTPAAFWLMATFSRSIDATYIPSLVTSPIEPETFHATTAVFADICDDAGVSMGMDGGGWIAPVFDGKIQSNRQIRGEFQVDNQTIAYVKGEGFVKWDACMWRVGENEWRPLWNAQARTEVCSILGLTDSEFRKLYWDAALATTSGYAAFTIGDVSFKMTPVVDTNQVKGNASAGIKALVAAGAIPEYTGYMGALRLEEGFSTMSSCFELMQWCRFDPTDIGPDYKSAVKIAVDRAQRLLAAKLVDENSDPSNPLAGIAAKMAQQDETVAVAMSILTAFNDTMRRVKPAHKDVSWYHIPTLRTRVIRGLERVIYNGADGGGISAPQVVYQLCNRLNPGECVYQGAADGQEVMTYRFPMSTHTAMVVAQARPAQDYPELWEDPWGKVSKHRMVMNSGDLTFRMQGDDDGDKGGATTDPEIIAMARDVWEHKQVDIEVRAKGAAASKYNEPLWSIEEDIPMLGGRPVHHPQVGAEYEEYTSGMELAGRSRRGAVGVTTRLQQRLHALAWQLKDGTWVYDHKAGERAIAMAWANQGEIDIEKKPVLTIDMEQALAQGLFPTQFEGENLVRHGALIEDQGTWRINPDLVADKPSAYDVKALSAMVKNRYLIAAGCSTPNPDKDKWVGGEFIEGQDVGNPIEWCNSDKRIDLTTIGWEGARCWPATGLEIDSIMHWSFRNMEEIWRQDIAPALGFKLDDLGEIDYESMGMGGQVEFGDLLRQVLVAKGESVVGRHASWFNDARWQTQRTHMGVDAYNKSMSDTYSIIDSDGETEERKYEARKMAAVRQQLLLRQRSLQDFSDLWALESWQHDQMLKNAEACEWEGQVVEASQLRRKAESCLNSMIRLVNFPESPVALMMGVTQQEVCDFLSKDVVEEMVASVYDRTDRAKTFAGLSNWIRTNGHKHAQVLDHNAKSKHMTSCSVCMTAAKQALVMRFRSDTQSGTANYFKSLIGYMNGTGDFSEE